MTLLIILADLKSVVVWIVSTRVLITSSSSPLTNSLVTLPSAPITVCTTVTFMFSIPKQGPGTYLSFRLPSILLWSSGTVEYTNRQVRLFFFCFFTITRSGRMAEIRWSVCILKSQEIMYDRFSTTNIGFCICNLFALWNLNFLHNSHWITFPIQSCLLLYSLCSNLLYLLVMWLIVSFLSLHNLHLLFYWVLSILDLILSFIL